MLLLRLNRLYAVGVNIFETSFLFLHAGLGPTNNSSCLLNIRRIIFDLPPTPPKKGEPICTLSQFINLIWYDIQVSIQRGKLRLRLRAKGDA